MRQEYGKGRGDMGAYKELHSQGDRAVERGGPAVLGHERQEDHTTRDGLIVQRPGNADH